MTTPNVPDPREVRDWEQQVDDAVDHFKAVKARKTSPYVVPQAVRTK